MIDYFRKFKHKLFLVKNKSNRSSKFKYNYLNKKFIIFGGGTGFGYEIAKHIFRHGGDIILISKNKEKLKKARNNILLNKKYKNNIFIYNFNLLNFENYSILFKKLKKKFKSIDFIFQCAALPEKNNYFPLLTSTNKYMKNSIKLNFLSNVYLFRNFIKFFEIKKKTRFVFFTSRAGWSNKKGHGVYNLTKSSLNSFVSSLSEELRFYKKYKNLEVICLEPGEAKTEMNKGSKDNTNKILKVIILLINSKKNLNGLFINRELTSLTYLNTKKISIHD